MLVSRTNGQISTPKAPQGRQTMLVFDVTVTVTVRNNVRRMRIKTAALLISRQLDTRPPPGDWSPLPLEKLQGG